MQQLRLCSILPFFWPSSPRTFPCNETGHRLRCRVSLGEQWEGAPTHVSKCWWPSTSPSYVPNTTGSLPFHFFPNHCTKLLYRGSVIRDVLVHKGQVLCWETSQATRRMYFSNSREPQSQFKLRSCVYTGGWHIQAPMLGRHGWLIVHLYQMKGAVRVWRGEGHISFLKSVCYQYC